MVDIRVADNRGKSGGYDEISDNCFLHRKKKNYIFGFFRDNSVYGNFLVYAKEVSRAFGTFLIPPHKIYRIDRLRVRIPSKVFCHIL